MPRPQTIETEEFHLAFLKTLNTRQMVGYDLSQKQACDIFDEFNRAERHNFWLDLSKILFKKQNQCLLHYRHCYSKAKYTESLTPFKVQIEQMFAELLLENYESNDIIKIVKEFLFENDIFPSAIESFVYQCVNRIKSNRRLRQQSKQSVISTDKIVQPEQQSESAILDQIQRLLM